MSPPESRIKIAVIGAGRVGQALGERWRALGHEVRYGVPDPTDAKYAGLGAAVGLPSEAAPSADLIVLATPWQATEAACRSMGPVAGKIVIDCTNPVSMGPAGMGHALGFATSAAERIQEWCRGAHVFKTLHQTGYETMADPAKHVVKPVMFVAGNDPRGKTTFRMERINRTACPSF